MSDPIKHECGIALVRLLKPLEFYHEKYGTPFYGLQKLFLMMQKQRNRGQDGAGIACVKLDQPQGFNFIDRHRSADANSVKKLFEKQFKNIAKLERNKPQSLKDISWLKENVPYTGELLMGHLRYGTHGKNKESNCHPVLRRNNWITRNLLLAGNFNMTNVKELFDKLIELGQHPREKSDTVTVLEKFGHFLDYGVQYIFNKYKNKGYDNREITAIIAKELDLLKIISRSTEDFDGGYAIAGMTGHGDSFVIRDPSGIRPAYYYQDDEVVVAASERPAIQSSFMVHYDKITAIPPAHALMINKAGDIRLEQYAEPREKKSCSFERIYFSRGTDKKIYKERQKLGYVLSERVLESVNHDFENTVFSFIPNTAEVCFYGLVKGVEDALTKMKRERITSGNMNMNGDLDELLDLRPRVEKIAVKDAKLRTFITQDSARDQMVSHVYDITYGTVRENQDNLVVIDDSIVRGTTLKKSILSILDRLSPKKIVVVSSAPQIRYPDCYGIDMSKLGEFVAFRAMVALLRDNNLEDEMERVYHACIEEIKKPLDEMQNRVKELYAHFTADQISKKISEIIRPSTITANVEVIYQTIEGLHESCPGHTGDWYFTGDYPTPGGNRVVNVAYINYMEGKNVRAY